MPIQIIEENKRPSFAQSVVGGLAQGGIQAFQQYQEAQKKQAEEMKRQQAFKQAGLDPSIANLPEAFQQAIAKQKFSLPEKPLTALQIAQQKLAEEKTKALQGEQDLFNNLFGQNKTNPQDQQNQQEQQVPEEQVSQVDPNNPQTWPEDVLTKMAGFANQPGKRGVIGNIAKNEKDRRDTEKKSKRDEFLEDRKYNTDFSKKAEEEAENIRSNLSKKEFSLDLSRSAVESGEVGALSLANLAQRLNIPEWQTMKGAQLETAIKENLLSNMSRVSAKGQNIWFEKRLNSMMAQIGKSQEANLAAQEILEGETAMDRSYLENFDRLADEDMKQYKFVKKDISKRAHDAAKHDEKEILKRTSYRLKELEEQEKGLSYMKARVGKNVTKGEPLTLAMAKLYKEKFGNDALKVAQKNGYYIPTIEEFSTFRASPQEFREDLQ